MERKSRTGRLRGLRLRGVCLVGAAGGLCLLAAIAAVTPSAEAAPAQFTLTLEGSHVPDASLPSGVRHQGPFTASAPFCPKGNAADTKDVSDAPPVGLVVLRTFTCDDGTGSFTALLPATREHGGGGPWRIVDGTGTYATLRGMGTYSSTRLSGDGTDLLSVTFRSTWTGTVDFDIAPPSIGLGARATKPRRPVGSYMLRIGITVPNEAPGATLAYTVDVSAGRASLAARVGTTTSGKATITLRIKPGRATRRVKVRADVTDPVGNKSAATQTVSLPR
jgi:hypothetical protein